MIEMFLSTNNRRLVFLTIKFTISEISIQLVFGYLSFFVFVKVNLSYFGRQFHGHIHKLIFIHLHIFFLFFSLFYSWHKYKSLWMYDKKVICDKYLNRGIPLVRLDEKFIFFTQIINDLENVKPHHDIKAIRINLRPLIQSIIEHAVEWRNTLGNMVSDRTNVEMVRMNVEFKVKFHR